MLKIFRGEFWSAFFKLLFGLASFAFLAVYIPVRHYEIAPTLTTDALLLTLGAVVGFTSLIIAWLST